jgi:hypothetical protein
MATFRCSAGIALALVCLACSAQRAQEPAPAAEQSPITRDEIEHVVPRRDFVGPMPARFEWTATDSAVDYAITIENEVDVRQFEARVRGTTLEWPKGGRLEPGTYFWRVVGLAADGRRVADSGRAAFVVTE